MNAGPAIIGVAETPLPWCTQCLHDDLDEVVRIHTNVVGCDPDSVRVGQRVRACFDDVDDTHAVVLFAPEPPEPPETPIAKDA